MKKILFIAFIVIASFAMAQPGGNFNPEERAKRQTEYLTKELDLSKDQAKKVEAINIKYSKKMMGIFSKMRDSGNFDREAMMEKRATLQKEQNKEMAAVLDDGQMKKYKKYLEERANRSRNRQGGGRR